MIKKLQNSLNERNSLLIEFARSCVIQNIRKKRFLNVLTAITLFLLPSLNFAQSPPNLGSASSFALFTAVGAFNNTGASQIVGDIGTNVGAFNGFPPGTVIGQIHVADAASAQAATDVDLAYGSMSTITCGSVISTTMGGGQTLLPNVYCLGAASTINGDLILDGQGDPTSLFIFKIDGALATTVNSRVILTNSASICNVYWQVNGEVDLGDNSLFQGTLLVNGAINLLMGSTLNGRGLSRAGAINLNTNIVNVPSQPIASITPSGPTTFCAGGSVTLTAADANTYLWSTGATTKSIVVTTGGNYSVSVSNGCFATSTPVTVTVNPLPNANAGTDKILTCLQTSVALTGSSSTPGVTFSWVASGGGNIVSGANTATPTVNTAGTYTLTVTNPTTGCSATDIAVVTLDGALPNVNAGTDKVLTCLQTSIALTGSSSTPGVTFNWVASGGGNIVSGATTATPTVNAAGTYTLTVTNPANGCAATDVALVTTNGTTPNANAGTDKVLNCLQTSVILTGSSSTPGVTFNWVASGGGNITLGATTATPTVNAAGTYTLTVTNPATGCTATDIALVTSNIVPPNANTGADLVLTCLQTSVILSGSSSTPGVTFNWVASGGGNIVSGANTATPTVNTAGTYTLTVTNPANGCSATDIALVTPNTALPNVNAGTNKILTCLQTSVVLTGSSSTPGVTFNWVASGGGNIVSGANTATPTVNTAGTYTLTVTNPANGCSATDIAAVTLDAALPNVNAGADQQLTCLQTSVVLNGSSSTPGVTFNWVASGGGNIVSGATTATPTVNAAGTYTLTVTNPATGCAANDIALVTSNVALPNVNAGADQQLTCLQTSVILNGSSSTPGVTFNWVASGGGNIVSGATTATPTVNATGTYTLTVTNPATGCAANDIALVTSNVALPNANAGADQQLTCLQTLVILNGSSSTPGVTFSWVASGGGNITLGANTATPTVNAAGTYTLTVTNPTNGCSSTDIAVVTTNGALPNVNAGADQSLTCLQTSLILNGSSSTPGVTFNWVASNGGNIVSGANTATPTVNTAGTYTLTVTNPANSCSASDIAVVILNGGLPNVNAGGNLELNCLQSSVILNGSSSTPGVTFSWVASNGGNIVSGANTATPTVNAAGTYNLIVTNPATGCAASDIALVTSDIALPNVNAGADQQLTCLQTAVILNGSSSTPGVTFNWVASNGGNIVSGANTATPTVNTAGTYTLTVTNPATGCSASDVAVVTLDGDLPNVNAGADGVLTCLQTSIILNGSSSTPGVTFNWVASNGGNIVSGANTATPTVNTAGTYVLTVISPATGCSANDIVIVTLDGALPNVDAGGDLVLNCLQTSVILSGSSSTPGVTFNWVASNGGNIVSGGNTATPTVNAAGTYTLTVTNPATSCSASDITLVLANTTLPDCIITGNDFFCPGKTTQLCVPAGSASYLWSTGATTPCINVSSAGPFSVTVTDANGCTSTCSKTVTPPIECLITGNDSFCPGSSTQLCAPVGFVTYLWSGEQSNGATTRCITITKPGTYTVTVTDANGCVSTCSKTVTSTSTPNCLISGNDSFSQGGSTEICAPEGFATYLWSNGATTRCITVTHADVFCVTVTTGVANECSATCCITVTIPTSVINSTIANSSINVFPNPSTETANIQLELPERCEGNLVLCDINGHVLYVVAKGTIEQKSNYIVPMSQFSSGIYLLKLHTDKGTVVKKIVK